MNRKIKFRAWDFGQFAKMDYDVTIMNGLDWSCSCDCEIKGRAIMQLTGLKDSKGIDIYEGDIVEWNDFYDYEDIEDTWHKLIKKDKGDTGWGDYLRRDLVTLEKPRHWLKTEYFGYEGEGLVSPFICKVIGNIYENPELLKGEKNG